MKLLLGATDGAQNMQGCEITLIFSRESLIVCFSVRGKMPAHGKQSGACLVTAVTISLVLFEKEFES